MTVQINADNNLSVHEDYSKKLEDTISKDLSRFDEIVTRIEVHLSDENGSKDLPNDKKCLLEARLKGRQPVVVSALGNTYDQALKGATDKIKASIDTITGRLKSHKV